MENYLYLEPYTLLFRKENECVFYNTLDFKVLKLSLTEELIPLIEQLESEKYAKLTTGQEQEEAFASFIKQLQATFNGDLLPVTNQDVPPAVFAPFINNQREFDRLSVYEWGEREGQVMNCLDEIYLYLNGCQGEEEFPAWRQLPSYLNGEGEIDHHKLINWLSSLDDKQISRAHLLGSDVLQHSHYKEIVTVLEQRTININLYYRYDNFRKEYKELLSDCINQIVWVVPLWNLDKDIFSSLIEMLSDIEQDTRWLLLVASEEDCVKAEELIVTYSLEAYGIKPIYSGRNISFFENAVYLTEEDILNIQMKKRDFYGIQKINKNDFGRLTVFPDGKVYANVNGMPVGEIGDRTVSSMLCYEIKEERSWFRIRNQKPCCDCIYQWLCPSPSNYEFVLNKPNLCNVKK